MIYPTLKVPSNGRIVHRRLCNPVHDVVRLQENFTVRNALGANDFHGVAIEGEVVQQQVLQHNQIAHHHVAQLDHLANGLREQLHAEQPSEGKLFGERNDLGW